MLGHPHLLLVDDDPAAIHAMRVMLDEFPHQRFASSGARAIELALEQAPDLVVLDINLPGMSGLEVCEAFQADPRLRRIPIIVATGDNAPDLEATALERGAVDFVSKPLQARQFRARVRAQLVASSKALPPVGERPGAMSRPPGRTSRLLIVDDDIAAIHFLRGTLDSLGDFYFATTGTKALELADAVRPDLILLDAQMPGMDGFEVCRQLKEMPALKTTPIVFVTRFSDRAHEMRALDMGAADFVSKPYAPGVMRARVRNMLELKRRHDADLQAAHDHWRRLSSARVSEAVRGASDAIICAGSDGVIVLANVAAGKLLASEQSQLIGRPLDQFLPDLSASTVARPDVLRLGVHRADGQFVPVEVSVSSTDEGDDSVTVVILRDVSWREELEAHERARVAAEAAHMAKSRMLSYVAHEMGNPLNAVMGFIQLLKSDASDPVTPRQVKWLDLAAAGARSLQGLLRDLLDMGRRESATFDVQVATVSVAKVVDAAIESVSEYAARSGIDVRSLVQYPGPTVLADARRLEQCLLNLLTNATKYNSPGGQVQIRVTADDARVSIAVEDNGIGMSADSLSRLFRAFERLGQEAQGEVPGSGLGLVITRQLLESMNSHLDVWSEPGAGSCFTIRLPRGNGSEG